MESTTRRRWLRRLAVLAGLVALYALVGFVLLPWWARGWLERELSDEYARPLTIERLAFNPFSLRARAEKVALVDDHGGPNVIEARIQPDSVLISISPRRW